MATPRLVDGFAPEPPGNKLHMPSNEYHRMESVEPS